MAAVTNAFAVVGDTTDGTSYVSPSFTPAAGDLLYAYVAASATADADSTLTASANGITFTLVERAVKNSSLDQLYLYIADQLVPGSPSAMTVTWDCTGDAATSAIIQVGRVSGMSKTGLTAIRQVAEQNNATAGTTPAPVFGGVCLTGNVVIGGLNKSTTTGNTPPAGFTEHFDGGVASPTTGAEFISRDSGFTSATVTYGGTVGTQYGVIVAELDTSASGTTHNQTPSDAVGVTDTVAKSITKSITTFLVGISDAVFITVKKVFTDNVGMADSASVEGEEPPLVFGPNMSLVDQKRAVVGATFGISDADIAKLSIMDLLNQYWSGDFPALHPYDTEESTFTPKGKFSTMDHHGEVEKNKGGILNWIRDVI